MKLKEIKERLKEIEKVKDDPESAHAKKDDLYRDFIKYVASINDTFLKEKAIEVLKVEKIDFDRWYS